MLAANPNVVVVNQSGMPIEMEWLPQASTVVQAFYGGELRPFPSRSLPRLDLIASLLNSEGNELGNGLADVLFGKRDPSGKLPVSFP